MTSQKPKSTHQPTNNIPGAPSALPKRMEDITAQQGTKGPTTSGIQGLMNKLLGWALGSDANPNNGSTVNSGRRAFLAGAAGIGVAALVGTSPSEAAAAQESPEGDNLTPQEEALLQKAADDMKEIEHSPESFLEKLKSIDMVHWALFLNFIDFINGLIQTGKRTPGNSVLTNVVSGLPRIGGKLLNTLVKKQVEWTGGSVKDFDKHFPHSNFYLAVALNLLSVGGVVGSEHTTEETIHGMKETGIGVGLLVGITSAADGMQLAEAGLVAETRVADEAIAEHAHKAAEATNAEGDKKPPEEIKNDADIYIKAICKIIGPAPFAAARQQIPFLAFGNADITRNKLETVLPLVNHLFELLMGQSYADLPGLSIENKSIKKILQKYAKNQGAVDKEGALLMARDFFTTIGVGMMSGTMDITQGVGDVAPAVVGSFQSFGAEEMGKTALVNFFYSWYVGWRETQYLAKRIGVEPAALWNDEARDRAWTMYKHSLVNFGKYLLPLGKNSKEGASFSIVTQVVKNLRGIFETVIQGIVHAAPDKLQEVLGASQDGVDLHNFEVAVGELKKLFDRDEQEIVAELQRLTEEEPEISAKDALPKAKNLVYQRKLGVNHDTQKRVGTIKAIINNGNQPNEIKANQEALTAALKELVQDIKTADIPKDNMADALSHILHIIMQKPHFLDLLRFDYWEQRVGSTLAETILIVTGQGLSLEAIKAVLNVTLYQPMVAAIGIPDQTLEHDSGIKFKTLRGDTMTRTAREAAILVGSSAIHTNISAVADNWADQILSAKQVATQIMLPSIVGSMGINTSEIKIDVNDNVLDIFHGMNRQISTLLIQGNRDAELTQMRELLYDKFLITKYVSTIFAILGGGESTIGNSPHFRAFVKKLKEIISLGASLKDIVQFATQHFERFGTAFVYSYIIGPYLEACLFANPFEDVEQQAA